MDDRTPIGDVDSVEEFDSANVGQPTYWAKSARGGRSISREGVDSLCGSGHSRSSGVTARAGRAHSSMNMRTHDEPRRESDPCFGPEYGIFSQETGFLQGVREHPRLIFWDESSHLRPTCQFADGTISDLWFRGARHLRYNVRSGAASLPSTRDMVRSHESPSPGSGDSDHGQACTPMRSG